MCDSTAQASCHRMLLPCIATDCSIRCRSTADLAGLIDTDRAWYAMSCHVSGCADIPAFCVVIDHMH